MADIPKPGETSDQQPPHDRLDAGLAIAFGVSGLAAGTDVRPWEGPGAIIGPYKLLQQIGEGGMGIVYMAEQEEPVRRKVAFKIIKPGLDSAQVIARFEAERQALAMMDHQNIAKVFDAGTTGAGRPYFVMELVHGVPITRFCDDHQLTPRERLQLFVPVCQAIQHAHQKGIIHRDIKPSNVLVTLYDDKQVPKVIDFGVAKAIEQRLTEKTLFTQFGVLVGTFEYMSPEQAEMNAFGVDTRSDIYSLGVLLYELLTGTTPLERERLRAAVLSELVRLIKEEEPPRPSVRLSSSTTLPKIAAARRTEPAKLSKLVRGEIDWIVMKCLEKDRSRRYETANLLARDLERHLHDESVEACPPSVVYRLRKFARKYRMPVIVAAAFALLLMAGVVGSTWQAVRARRAEGDAIAKSDLAREAEAEATKKRREAEAAREQARTAEARSHRLYYAGNVSLVQAAWEGRNVLRLHDLLAETAAFTERGFEWYYWQRVCHVEHLTLAGHKGGVTALAFSPDGQRLVTGVTDGTAMVWDATCGQELFCLRGHRGEVTAVAFAPDGQWLVTGSTDGTSRLWEAVSGRELRMLQAQEKGPILAVVVTSDGKRVITGSHDGTARVWDAVSCKELLTFKGHTGQVWAVAVTGDGKRVVTGGLDRTARIWDAVSGHELLKLEGHLAAVSAVAVDRDGKRVVTGSLDGTARIWDMESGTAVLTLPGGHGDLLSLAVTPDGQRLVTGYWGGTANVRDMVSGREILTLMGHKSLVNCVGVSLDGQRLATGSLVDGTARVWDVASGRGTRTLKVDIAAFGSMALTPDGQRLVTRNPDGAVRLWDVASGRELLKLNGESDRVWSVAITPDGKRIVTGCEDGRARVWDAGSGRELRKLEGHTRRIWSLAVTPDGQRIVTGSWDGTARVWDAVSGRELLKLEGHTGPVFCVAVTSDGRRLVTGSEDSTARVWDAVSGRELLKLEGHPGRVWSVAVTPDGQRIVTGSWDGTVRVWNAVSGRELMKLAGHIEPGLSLAVSPDSQRLVTGSGDGTAAVWDAVSGRELLTLKGHTGPVWSVAVTSDGRRVITGSDDGTVKIWEAASPELVARWTKQEDKAAGRQAAWQRPVGSAPGFIRDWLVLAPLPLQAGQSSVAGLDCEQVPREARLNPRAGDRVPVGGQEYPWRVYRAKEPVLDFNRLLGKLNEHCVAYAVCYVISKAERKDLLLQVGSDNQAKVYLNGQEVYKYSLERGLVPLHMSNAVTLHQGTNVLVFKVVNDTWAWLGCLRFVDPDGNPAEELRVSLTPNNVTLTGGVSSQGGAVFIGDNASLTLDSDILSGNEAVGDTQGNALGGAVYNSSGASLTVANTLFANNQSNGTQESFGGAIANAGTLSIDEATFTGNEALGSTAQTGASQGGSQGGAIGNLDGSTSTIKRSAFTANEALGDGAGAARGGAICNEDVVIFPATGSGVSSTVFQCTFENNTARGGSNATDGGYGGAIIANPGVNLAVLNSSFTGNQANSGGGLKAVGGAIVAWLGDSVTISDSQFISNSAVGSGVGATAEGGALGNLQTMTISNSLFTGNSALAGPMADGTNTLGQALGGAIVTGFGINNNAKVFLTISNSVVAGNEAIGGSGGSTLPYPRTDAAAGGGIANVLGGTLIVAGSTIAGNQAVGCPSASGSGGVALGGGIENEQATLNLTDSTISTNLCQGGAGASGSAGGIAAGGGIDNSRVGALAILTNCTLSLNESLGGAGGAEANGGAGVGGGIANAVFSFAFGNTDSSSLAVSNCQIVGNMGRGGMAGSSAVGGDGLGGGLFVSSGTVTLEAGLVSNNQSEGGIDSQGKTTGNGLGGGVYVDPSATATADMQTLIAGNQATKSNNDVWGTITMVP